MSDYFDLLFWEFLDNELYYWLFFLVLFFAALIVMRLARRIFLKRAGAIGDSEIAASAAAALKTFGWPFYLFAAAYAALNVLKTNVVFQQLLYYAFLAAAVFYGARAVSVFAELGLKRAFGEKEADAKSSLLSALVRVGIWIGAALVLLPNLGYDVTSLLAGLGLGGLAMAMASQQILADIIAAFTIYFDKPFKIGDRIAVGDCEGAVEKIGLRSVRLRGSAGEEIIIPNSEISKTKLRNFRK